MGIVVGGTIGIILPLLEIALPRWKKFIPSATGLGIAFTINGFNAISFFIGACLAALFKRAKPALAKEFTVPVSSGIIAGESLMGVAVAFGRYSRSSGEAGLLRRRKPEEFPAAGGDHPGYERGRIRRHGNEPAVELADALDRAGAMEQRNAE